MTDWVRLWHDMPTDPKWRVIARKSGRSIAEVIAVFNFVMVNASANATERGRTHNLFAEDIAAALDLDEADIDAILAAMEGKVLLNGTLAGWDKRQPKREDNSASRAKEWREKQKAERNRTQPNATERPETDTELPDTDVSGAEAPGTPIDLAKALFDSAVPYLVAHGSKSANARSMVASWRKEHGDGPVIDAVAAAQREAVSEPIPFIIKVLERRNGKSTGRVQRNDPPAANPLLAAAVRRYGNRDSPDDRLDFGSPGPPTGRD